MNAVSDGWVRDVVVDRHAEQHHLRADRPRRVTLENVHIRHTMPFTAPAAPADFAISGTQILLHRSSVTGKGVWPVVTQAGVTGPNVVLNFKATAPASRRISAGPPGCSSTAASSPNGTERRPNIAFSNREYAGSGHGWSVGWAVAWNVKADYLLIQQPPGAKNWCIGCTGRPTPILWHGDPVPIPDSLGDLRVSRSSGHPPSLYLAQLCPASTHNSGLVKVTLQYGTTGLDVDLPDDRVDVIAPRHTIGLADERAQFTHAVRHPIGSAPLASLIGPRDRVAVVIPDLTRPFPSARVLPWLFEELAHVPPANVVILLGNGSHRAATDAEIAIARRTGDREGVPRAQSQRLRSGGARLDADERPTDATCR